MDTALIRAAIAAQHVRVTDHADEDAASDRLLPSEVIRFKSCDLSCATLNTFLFRHRATFVAVTWSQFISPGWKSKGASSGRAAASTPTSGRTSTSMTGLSESLVSMRITSP